MTTPENYDYNGSYRLVENEIAVASLTTTYNISAFTRQNDQPAIVDWLAEPLEGSDIYRDIGELVDDMAGGAGTWANGSFDWYMGYWTPLMTKYFMNRFFANGLGSRLVTAMTFDRGYGYRVVWATMRRPVFTEATPAGFGYSPVKVSFVDARAAS